MELRPVEIAMRRFSRTPFGLDPKEVREFLAEVAAAVDRLNSELAKISMERKTAGTGADELRRQLEAANAKIAEYHQQESLLSKAVLDVQKVTEEMTEGSRAEAERIVADAKAAAEEMMQTARKEAADLLRDARARGQEAVSAAERAAATRLGQVEEEAERLLEQARQEARELYEAGEQKLQGLISRIEGALSDSDRTGFFQQLEVLSETHTDALETVEGLQAEVSEVLPKLRQLLDDIKDGRTSPAAARLRERRSWRDRAWRPAACAVSPSRDPPPLPRLFRRLRCRFLRRGPPPRLTMRCPRRASSVSRTVPLRFRSRWCSRSPLPRPSVLLPRRAHSLSLDVPPKLPRQPLRPRPPPQRWFLNSRPHAPAASETGIPCPRVRWWSALSAATSRPRS